MGETIEIRASFAELSASDVGVLGDDCTVVVHRSAAEKLRAVIRIMFRRALRHIKLRKPSVALKVFMKQVFRRVVITIASELVWCLLSIFPIPVCASKAQESCIEEYTELKGRGDESGCKNSLTEYR